MQIITLITDYGTTDTYLAELKLAIMQKCKNIYLLDVCHDIDINEITAAAFQLKNILPYLKDGSVNVVAVNNNYKLNPVFLVFQYEGKYFIGPDNGIFSLVFEDFDQMFKIDQDKSGSQNTNQIISHAIACIHHNLGFEEFAVPVEEFDRRLSFRPVVSGSQIRASIIHIDHFGNAITNITKEMFEKARQERSFSIYFKPNDPLHHICRSYADASPGEVLCLFNHSGYLEIAVNSGNASMLLNLYKNETIQIDFY